jgi:hypothetical protein
MDRAAFAVHQDAVAVVFALAIPIQPTADPFHACGKILRSSFDWSGQTWCFVQSELLRLKTRPQKCAAGFCFSAAINKNTVIPGCAFGRQEPT